MFGLFRYFFALVVLSLGVFGISVADDRNFGAVVVDEVTSIYDGDTFRVNINDWLAIIG
ncbi:hypothetical protein [Hydrogenovibrio thermophilus]|uniref:hypothetical protein n=1 Tax=Hydrogenovibrio thermophilus TaxID=265883 RepID=UPI001863C4F8|nr:hypothetical protein [Hydrogenovibrio thermophilus]